MKRISPALLAACVLVGGTAGAPASATPTEACIGAGAMGTALPLFWPAFGPRILTAFAFAFGAGACTTAGPAPGKVAFGAVGMMHGWCWDATGFGTTANGRSFGFIWAGLKLVTVGTLEGAGTLVQDIPAGENCALGADGFLIGGLFVLSPT